jgi:uncharacterized protein
MINRKAIFSYLLITFAITYLIEGSLILAGLNLGKTPSMVAQLAVYGVMWVPALAAVITTKLILREKLRATTGLRFGSWKPYVVSMFVFPLVFLVAYTLTWALGLGAPDFQMKEFMVLVTGASQSGAALPRPEIIALGIFGFSVFVAPFFNGIFGFGEEWGWRGFLLPHLMPLGKTRAYLLMGVIWGLWHAPLIVIGFGYPGSPVLGIIGMIFMTTTFGIYINELSLRYRSSILAGWIHGAFNCQAYGVWKLIFPNVNPMLGGINGLVGSAVLLGLGLIVLRLGKNKTLPAQRYTAPVRAS